MQQCYLITVGSKIATAGSRHRHAMGAIHLRRFMLSIFSDASDSNMPCSPYAIHVSPLRYVWWAEMGRSGCQVCMSGATSCVVGAPATTLPYSGLAGWDYLKDRFEGAHGSGNDDCRETDHVEGWLCTWQHHNHHTFAIRHTCKPASHSLSTV